jgi:cellulose synthase operon protein C
MWGLYSETVRRLALLFLLATAGFDWSGQVSTLKRELASIDPERRRDAVQKLAELSEENARPLLLSALGDGDPMVRIEAARVLARRRFDEAVGPISEWLSSGDKATRIVAAEVLGEIRSTKAIPALTRILGDGEADVRRSAVEALGKIGGPDVVPPIVSRLDDDSTLVRREAAEKLVLLGDARAVVPLLERLEDTVKEVRVAAVRAIGKLGDDRAATALLRLLRDPEEMVRMAAAEALGNLRAASAAPVLIPLLGRGSDEMKAKVAYALGQIRDEHGVRELVRATQTEALRGAAREALAGVGAPAVDPLLACLAGTLECDLTVAVDVLKTIGDARATPALLAELNRGRVRTQGVVAALAALADRRALVPLLSLLDHADAPLKVQILDAVRPIIDGRAAGTVQRLLDDPSEDVRARAAQALGVLQARSAVPRLLSLAAAGETAAVSALGEIGDARAVAPLLGLLDGGRGESRRAAAEALARIKGPEVVDGLLRIARTGATEARVEALSALGGALRGHGTPEAAEVCAKALDPGDPALALSAVGALAAMREPHALGRLLPAARGSQADLRRGAVEVLGNFGDAQAGPVLRAALADEDDSMRGAAAWALGKLGDAAARPDLVRAAQARGFATQVNAAAALARMGDAGDLLPLATHPNAWVRANVALGLARFATPEAQKARAALAKDASPAVRAATAAAAPRRGDDWIRLTVKDKSGAPRRHKPYVLTLPDGLTKAGYTDLRGVVAEEQVVTGSVDFDVVEDETR